MKTMMTGIKAVLLPALFLCLGFNSFAAPINGLIFEVSQPDKSKVKVRIWGDEYYARTESIDGYTLTKNNAGYYSYAVLSADGNALESTGVVYKGNPFETELLSNPSLKSLAKGLKLNEAAVKAIRDSNYRKLHPANAKSSFRLEDAAPSPAPLSGTIKGLTILIDFADEPATITKTQINNFFNQVGYTGFGNNGSVRDYYRAVSGNKLDYTNQVVGYYRAAKPKSYYDQIPKYGDHEIFLEALNAINPTFDFSTLSTENGKIRAINFLYAGNPSHGWTEGLWPHSGGIDEFSADGVQAGSYMMTNIGSELTLATTCHENGHMIMHWPDLYDYNGSYGVGGYCLMSGMGDARNPVPPCAYLRYDAGWETPVEVKTDLAAGLNSNSTQVLKYTNPNNIHEYFLLESRTKTGRSASLPDEGLIIWHIDENSDNANGQSELMLPNEHFKVSVEQADGLFDLEKNVNGGDAKDLFKAGYKTSFSDNTLPDAHWWDGSASGLQVTNISAPGSVQTMSIKVKAAPTVCSFGAPLSYPLHSTGYLQYHYAHVAGSGGPNLSNMTIFSFQYDQANTGFYNFNLNTNNGSPAWFVDLLPKTLSSLNSYHPSVTISGSGINGLDGTWYVAPVNSDLVLVSNMGDKTIYFSNSSTPPACSQARTEMAENLVLSPVPAGNKLSISSENDLSGSTLLISDEIGNVQLAPVYFSDHQVTADLSNVHSGVYLVKLTTGTNVITKKIVVSK